MGEAYLIGAVFSCDLMKVLRSLGKPEGKLARECGAILSFVSRSVWQTCQPWLRACWELHTRTHAGAFPAHPESWRRECKWCRMEVEKASSWEVQPGSSEGIRHIPQPMLLSPTPGKCDVSLMGWTLPLLLCKSLEASMDPSGSLWDQPPSAATHPQLKIIPYIP